MKHWRMRTTLMVSLLAVSLGMTAVCLLIIRLSVQREIGRGLDSDLGHSLSTFRNMANQRNQMLARESSLLSDLPSLKALMSTQDKRTIQDGSAAFWNISGGDFFALTSAKGDLVTYSNLGRSLIDDQVKQGLQVCMAHLEDICTIAFSNQLYELSIQPVYFGPPANGSQLGYVTIGYAIDQKVANQVSEVASADVAFLIDGEVSATTLPSDRLSDLRRNSGGLDSVTEAPKKLRLGREVYMAAASALPAVGGSPERAGHVELIVLKSYDRASMYLRRVNQWILILGICALLIGVLLAASVSRTVTRPLEALVAGTRALGQGNFNYRLSTEGAIEVRELAGAFDRMRGELQRTQQELLESDRLATIGRMASSVSHDLRHHLSAIYANAEFMSLEHAGADERLELLIEVKDGVQGMTELIESLLFFSHNGHVLHLQQESIPQLVERTLHNLRQHPECRKVRITMQELHPALAFVDNAKLSRALYNLMLNACQAAATGSQFPVITVAILEDEEAIRIAVSDNGAGIPQSIRDTLFQPFVSSGKVNGTGLGLTVAQHIVQEHGGEIQLEHSATGKTVFTIVLYKKTLEALDHIHAVDAGFARPQPAEGSREAELASSQERP